MNTFPSFLIWAIWSFAYAITYSLIEIIWNILLHREDEKVDFGENLNYGAILMLALHVFHQVPK